MNLANIVDSVNGDLGLLRELADLLIASSQENIKTLDEAIKVSNFNLLKSCAHNLKGSLLEFGLDTSVKLASQLEVLGESQELKNAETILSDLKVSVAQDHQDINSAIRAMDQA